MEYLLKLCSSCLISDCTRMLTWLPLAVRPLCVSQLQESNKLSTYFSSRSKIILVEGNFFEMLCTCLKAAVSVSNIPIVWIKASFWKNQGFDQTKVWLKTKDKKLKLFLRFICWPSLSLSRRLSFLLENRPKPMVWSNQGLIENQR